MVNSVPPSQVQNSLSGRAALVTGAKGGLGAAIGDDLHSRGVRVFGTARDRSDAERIAERYGTVPVVLDVLDREGTRAVINELDEQWGPIDLLCNNAGVNIPQPAIDVDDASWDMVMDTNVTGPFVLTQALARRWIARGRSGVVVNVSSQAGTVAIAERAAYCSSKAAISHLTRVLALEWAPHGIRVNAVAPTFIRTELTESTLGRPGMLAEITSRIPMGRIGVPADVAGAVAFLMGDEASFITGHILAVDGGYTIH